jgi:hypothetical protein
MWPFRRKDAAVANTGAGAPIDEEHEQLRRAIERCDALKLAYDAGQLTLEDLVATLHRNNFSKEVVRKAVAESLGEDAARRLQS